MSPEGRTPARGGAGRAQGALIPRAPDSRVIEALLAPADRLRAVLYRTLAPRWAQLFVDRERRVAWLGAASVLLALALTATVPLGLLALGPLLLGVPHLVADLRYLVLRPGLHRRPALCLAAALPLAATGFGAPAWVGLLALAVAVLGARCPPGQGVLRLAGATVWVLLAAWAAFDEAGFVLAFVHAHNLLALALWWTMRPRGGHARALLLLAALGTLLLLCGAADAPALAGPAPAGAPGFEAHALAYAPGLGATWAVRVVLCFAFLQALHYAVWLRLVPDDARDRPAPRPWRSSWRALRAELGAPLLVAALLLALAIALWGAMDLAAARWGYLRLAAFHGYLELAVALLALLERRPLLGVAGEPPAPRTGR